MPFFIGKRVRNLRHLIRSVGVNNLVTLIDDNLNQPIQCGFISLVLNNGKTTNFLFNDRGGDQRLSSSLLSHMTNEQVSLVQKQLEKYRYLIVLNDGRLLKEFGRNFILISSNLDDDYATYCKQNKKLFENIFSKYISSDSVNCKLVYMYCSTSPNMFAWILNNYFKHNIPWARFKSILAFANNYPQLISQLANKSITAYNGHNQIKNLIDEIINLRRIKRASTMANAFNTAQKKILKTHLNEDITIHALNRLARLSPNKQHNFIRKMSTITDIHEIMRQLMHLTNGQFIWDKNVVLDYITNGDSLKCDIVVNKDNILIVKVHDFETIKYLAKTTNWCISKNKSYWQNYINHANHASQFIIFDFNKKEDDEFSIVGFTLHDRRGITAAHSFSNKNILGSGSNNQEYLDCISFLSQNPMNDIFSLFKEYNISLETFYKYEPFPFAWNQTSFLNELEKNIADEEYTLYYASDNGIVLNAKLSLIKKIFQNSINFPNNFGFDSSLNNNSNIFIFLDFTKSPNDITSLLWGVVEPTNHYCEEVFQLMNRFSNRVYSTSFEKLLEKYDLPFDIIRRPSNDTAIFKKLMLQGNINSAKKYITNDKIIDECKKDTNWRRSFNQINSNIIFEHSSYDMVKFIYDNNRTLNDFISTREISQLLGSIIETMSEMGNMATQCQFVPNESHFQQLQNHNLNDFQKTVYVGRAYIFDMIIRNENKLDAIKVLSSVISNHKYINDYLQEFLLNYVFEVFGVENFKPYSHSLHRLIKNSDKYKSFLNSNQESSPFDNFSIELVPF